MTFVLLSVALAVDLLAQLFGLSFLIYFTAFLVAQRWSSRRDYYVFVTVCCILLVGLGATNPVAELLAIRFLMAFVLFFGGLLFVPPNKQRQPSLSDEQRLVSQLLRVASDAWVDISKREWIAARASIDQAESIYSSLKEQRSTGQSQRDVLPPSESVSRPPIQSAGIEACLYSPAGSTMKSAEAERQVINEVG